MIINKIHFMSVNKNILSFLKGKAISQLELAKKLQTSHQGLNRILNSEDLKVSQLIEITKALDLPTHFFFDDYKEESNNNNEADKKRIAELEEILKDKKAWIKTMHEMVLNDKLESIEWNIEAGYIKEKEGKELMATLLKKYESDPQSFFNDYYYFEFEAFLALMQLELDQDKNDILDGKISILNEKRKYKKKHKGL